MIGARIAALRRDAGMNQAQLAGALGISPSAVGMYEQGRREPSIQTLRAIAEVFGVTVDYLVSGKPDVREVQRVRELLANRVAAAERRLEDRPDRPFSREELAVLFAAMLMES